MNKESWFRNSDIAILCGNIVAAIIIAFYIISQGGVAGLIDVSQILCILILMVGELMVIRLFRKKERQSVLKYAGLIMGLVTMLLTIGNYARLYGTVNLLFFRISIISLFWGNIFNIIIILILGKYIARIRRYICKLLAYRRLRKDRKLQKTMDILWDAMKHQEDEKEAERLNNETKCMRHDMKNQMNVLQILLVQGAYEKAQEYLAQYYGKLQAVEEESCYCKNEMINLLIKNSKGICQRLGITFYAVICNEIPKDCNIDLCVLLGNALDNAVEGCGGEKPQIYLDIRRKENFLLIDVRNTIQASVLENNPALKTTKKDHTMHGMGIASMRNLAEKYCGTIEFGEEDGFFVCSILLDLETE